MVCLEQFVQDVSFHGEHGIPFSVLTRLLSAEQSAAFCRTVHCQTVMLKMKGYQAQCSNSWLPLQLVLP